MNMIAFKLTMFACVVICLASPSVEARERGGEPTLGSGPALQTGLELYVSRRGHDRHAGTHHAPFKSVEKARDTIAALKQNNALPDRGVTVWIRGGHYPVDQSFILRAQHSGEPDKPIIYRAYPGEKVWFVGGVMIASELWQPLSRQARQRLHPQAPAETLRQLDVHALGLKHVDAFAPNERFADNWYIISLFANNRRQEIARWPNPQENIRGVNDPGWTTCNGSKDNRTFYYGGGGDPKDGDGTNEADLDGSQRIQRWQRSLRAGHELWLKGTWRTPWSPWTLRVETIHTSDEWIRFTQEPYGGMGSKYTAVANEDPLWRVGSGKEKWFAINLLDEIDRPGEWALDIKDRMLYYWPVDDLQQLDVMIADLGEPMITVEGAAHIQLIGLGFKGGQSHGIELKNSAHVLIAGCTLANIGDTAIRDERGSYNIIQSNDIYEAGGWGIELKQLGDRPSLTSAHCQIINNHIHHIGRLSFKEALRMDRCVGVTVAHNLMHDLPKGAVRHDKMNNCTFEYNEIHNIALKESDTGTIYGYGGWSTYGNEIRYNFTHHTNRANGFYCDDGDSGDVFYENIVQGAINALKFGGGHHNLATHNLLVQNQTQAVDDRGISRNYRIGTNYEKRLREMNPLEEPWTSYGRQLQRKYGIKDRLWEDILDEQWHPEWPNGTRITDNVAVASGSFKKPKHGDVTIRDNVILQTLDQALFYDYEQMDLRTDNPVILAKFPQLHQVWQQAGLITDAYRIRVVTRKEVGGLHDRGKKGDPWEEDQFVD